MAHAMVVVALEVQGYLLAGPTRSNVLLLLALPVVTGMFRLTPRQLVGIGLYAAVMMSAAMLLVGSSGGRLDMQAQLMYVALTCACLAAMVLIGRQVSLLRLRQVEQGRALRAALERAHELATHDALTGLTNRLAMEQRLAQQAEGPGADATPLAVALLDLDHFKAINDSFGHRVGDAVLQRFADEARAVLREAGLPTEVLARWGGEEFLLAVPGVAGERALELLQQVRQRLMQVRWDELAPGLSVSFSAGLAVRGHGDRVEQVIERADRGLYDAKHAGRDCLRMVLA